MKKNITRNFFGFIALTCFLVGCSGQPAQKEIITVEVPAKTAPTPAPVVNPVIIQKEAPQSGTKVTFDKNGVKVEGGKVDIDIKK